MTLSFEKLSQMLLADHKSVKTRMPIDLSKVTWLLDTQQEFMSELINPLKTIEGEGWVKQNLAFLKYAKQYTRKGYITNSYSTNRKSGKKGYGRNTPDKGKSALSLNKMVRGFLFEDVCDDNDFKNMHVNMICQIATLFEQDRCVKLLQSYDDNREFWYKEMMNANPKLTRDMCKEIGYTFLYEGSPDHRFAEFNLEIPTGRGDPLWMVYATCKDACKEVIKLREKIKKHFSETWENLPYNNPKRMDAGKFSSMVQHLEKCVLMKLIKKCKGDGYDVVDLQHDGLFLSEQESPADAGQDWFDEVRKFILKETGFDLQLTCKAFKVPDQFRTYNPCTDDIDHVDEEKVDKCIPDTDILDLEKMKPHRFPHLNDNEKELLGRKIAGKYFIRSGDHWFKVNIATGLWNHTKPLGKDAYNNTVMGSILEGTMACQCIKVYDDLVFKDPRKIRDTEWNTYYKQLNYDPSNRADLDEDELNMIDPIISHFKNIWCRGDEKSYEFLMKVLQDKFSKPFDIPERPVCLVLFGKEGAGKTKPAEVLFDKAFGEPYVAHSVNFKGVTNSSGHTDALESKLVAIMNEIPEMDYNHKEMFEQFKTLVSEKFRRSRRMYQGEKSVPNSVFYLLTTNNKNACHVTQTDRRYFMLDVASTAIGDQAYFRDLITCIEDQWELFIQYVLNFKVTEGLTIPDNKLRSHAKQLSLCPVGQWLQHRFNEDPTWDPQPDEGHSIMELYSRYKGYMQEEQRRAINRQRFHGVLSGSYSFIEERRTGDMRKKWYIDDIESLKMTLGIELD